MLLAHTAANDGGGGGAAPIVLVLLGIAALVGGFAFDARRENARWALWTGVAVGAVLIGLSFVVGSGDNGGDEAHVRPNAQVSLLEPRAGDVPAGRRIPVRVAVDGAAVATSPTDTEGGHLHLSVDGKLQQMPYATETEVTLPPGEHEIEVEYVDDHHVSYDPPIVTKVRVRAA